MSRKRGAPVGELDKREWDFANVTEAEREACCLWEYGREFAKGAKCKHAFETYRQKASGSNIRELSKVCFGFPLLANGLILSQGDLPSWRTLKAADREELINSARESCGFWERHPRRHFHAEIATKKEPSGLMLLGTALDSEETRSWLRRPPFADSLEDFEAGYEAIGILTRSLLEKVEFGYLAINWASSKKDIEASFKAWLDEAYKVRGERRVEPSRGLYLDRLKSLGCKRVAEHYPRWQLSGAEVPNGPALVVGAPVAHVSTLQRGKKRACQLLDQMELVGDGLR